MDANINVPTIALTANAMKHEVEQYLNNGFTDHLSKPIQSEIFNQKLSLYLCNDVSGSEDSVASDTVSVQMVEQFKQTLPDRVEVLENAFFSRDWRAICMLSHSLKGAALSFSLDVLGEICTDIEALANAVEQDNSRANDLADSLLKLKAEVERYDD